MKIISGRSNPSLAIKLAKTTNAEYIGTKISYFKDSELKIQIPGDLRHNDLIIVQSTCNPVNDNLMELLFLADAAKKALAKKIIAVVPYLCYSRQDSLSHESSAIASSVARLIEASGIDCLVTIDLHSEKIKDFYKIPVHNIFPFGCFSEYIQHYDNSVIISPDKGGAFRAKAIGSLLQREVLVLNKIRDHNNQCHMSDIEANVHGKHCIIIDDIVDTGDTILKASMLLMKKGALSIDAFITHSVLSNDAEQIIQDSVINRVYVTDTIPFVPLCTKFCVIGVVNLLADYLVKLC